MTEKKNQHFVPQLHLRQFSINKNKLQIGLFFLDKEVFNKAVPLRSQAKDDYFYGKDGALEDRLSQIESLAAPVLQNIIDTNTLPKRLSPDFDQLFNFSIVMAYRTKDAAAAIKEYLDKLADELGKLGDEYQDKINNSPIFSQNPAALALEISMGNIAKGRDLKVKLLINKTQLKFITSDHPVVKYNQYLEQRKHPGGNTGIATKGLQMFFPISPYHMLCFYDDQVYKIGGKIRTVIEITELSDIEQLNFIQILNCFDHIYFNHEISEQYIRQLYSKAKIYRLQEYSTIDKTESFVDNLGQKHVRFHSYGNNLKVNLSLNVVNLTKKAKQYILSDYVAQFRNENLRGNNDL